MSVVRPPGGVLLCPPCHLPYPAPLLPRKVSPQSFVLELLSVQKGLYQFRYEGNKKIKKIKKAFSVFPYHKFSRRKICSPTYISNTTYRGLGPQEWWFLSKTFSHTEKAVPRWKTDRGDLHALTLVTVQMLCLEGLQPLPPLSQPPTYTYRGGHLTQAQRRPFSRKEKNGKTLQ